MTGAGWSVLRTLTCLPQQCHSCSPELPRPRVRREQSKAGCWARTQGACHPVERRTARGRPSPAEAQRPWVARPQPPGCSELGEVGAGRQRQACSFSELPPARPRLSVNRSRPGAGGGPGPDSHLGSIRRRVTRSPYRFVPKAEQRGGAKCALPNWSPANLRPDPRGWAPTSCSPGGSPGAEPPSTDKVLLTPSPPRKVRGQEWGGRPA